MPSIPTYEDLAAKATRLEKAESELKSREMALEEINQRYKTIFNHNPNPIVIFDKTGRFLEVNQVFIEFGEINTEAIEKHNISDFAPPDTWPECRIFEIQYIANDHTKTLELNITPVSYNGVEAFMGIGRDITESLRARQALASSESQKNAILDASIDSIRLVDKDMKIIWANKINETQLGKDRAKIIGNYCYRAFTGRSKPCPNCPTLKARKSGKIEHSMITETNVKGIQGNSYWADYAVPIKNESGEIVNFIQVSRDITDIIRAQEALRESEKRYKFLAENMDDIVWTLDMELNTTYISPSIEKILGFTPEQRKQQTLEQMIAPDSLEQVINLFLNEIENEKNHQVDDKRSVTIEVEYYHKDGSTVWLENSVKAIRDQAGVMTGLYGCSRNISDRKRAEQELKNERDRLKEAMSKIKQLSGLLPICSCCKKIRDDKGYWNQIENYILQHSDADFTHSICPECAEKMYPDLSLYKNSPST